jgi:hypothetical protein
VKRTRAALGCFVTNSPGLELFELKFQVLIHQHQRFQSTPQIAIAHRDYFFYLRLGSLIQETLPPAVPI